MTAPPGWRAAATERLTRESFDVLVVGGGISGAGIARDAARRGLTVALLERDDFASGTSSRSSRLIHGGLRYLEHGHLRLVFESSRERRTLLHIAPHLVRPLAFTWPVYRGARIGRGRLFAGLALYDGLALLRNVARHERLSTAAILAAEPSLRPEGLLGGARYFDASTDDARLTLANLLDASAVGAVVVNHMPVVAFVAENGRAAGVEATDALRGGSIRIRARVVVNATGPWSDDLRVLEAPATRNTVRGSKGAHVAVPRARVGNRGAVSLLHAEDGRVLFAIPAGRHTIIGTTETDATMGPSDVRADREDVRYLLAAANAYFPGAALVDRDVMAAWAGVRPLVASLVPGEPGAASREHAVAVGATGVLHVTGGKLTTYRVMARDVVDQVVNRLGGARRPCRTAELPLPGGELPLDSVRAAVTASVDDPDVAERLATAHGTRWGDVWALGEQDARLRARVTPALPYVGAEFLHGVEAELACTLGDLLMRRTHAAFESPDHALSIAPAVAALVAPALGWDPAQAVREYEREVEKTFSIQQ